MWSGWHILFTVGGKTSDNQDILTELSVCQHCTSCFLCYKLLNKYLEQLSLECQKVIGFTLLCLMIGRKNLCFFFISPMRHVCRESRKLYSSKQNDFLQANLRGNWPLKLACRHFPALCDSLLQLFISSIDWFIGLSQCVVCDCWAITFGCGFTTLNWKPLR